MKLSKTILALAAVVSVPSTVAMASRQVKGGAVDVQSLNEASATTATTMRVLQDETEGDEEESEPDMEVEETEEEEPEQEEETEVEEEEDNVEAEEEEEEEADTEEDEAEETEEEEEEDDADEPFVPTNERTCNYFTSRQNEFDFKCTALQSSTETNIIEDTLSFNVQVDGSGVVISVSLEQEAESETMEMESEMGFKVRFDRLIEYKKGIFEQEEEIEVEENEDEPVAVARQAGGSPADNAYNFDEDTIIQEFDLSDWADLTPIVESGSGNLLSFSANTLGVADFKFTIAQATEGAISANSMKIDVTIEDFPWLETGSYLALISKVETEYEVEVDDDSEEENDETPEMLDATVDGPGEADINFSQIGSLLGYEAFGRYAWAPTAEATTVTNSTDGRQLQMTNNIQVIATTKPGDDGKSKQDIVFSFVGAGASGADRIYWDPETGVGYNVQGSSASALRWVFGGSVLAALAAVVVPAIFV